MAFTNGSGIAAASSMTTNSAWLNLFESVGTIYYMYIFNKYRLIYITDCKTIAISIPE